MAQTPALTLLSAVLIEFRAAFGRVTRYSLGSTSNLRQRSLGVAPNLGQSERPPARQPDYGSSVRGRRPCRNS
jgi:hypothetical protein